MFRQKFGIIKIYENIVETTELGKVLNKNYYYSLCFQDAFEKFLID